MPVLEKVALPPGAGMRMLVLLVVLASPAANSQGSLFISEHSIDALQQGRSKARGGSCLPAGGHALQLPARSFGVHGSPHTQPNLGLGQLLCCCLQHTGLLSCIMALKDYTTICSSAPSEVGWLWGTCR
jgi:hypothetical protein